MPVKARNEIGNVCSVCFKGRWLGSTCTGGSLLCKGKCAVLWPLIDVKLVLPLNVLPVFFQFLKIWRKCAPVLPVDGRPQIYLSQE